MLEDLKTAVRALRHSPTFTAVALVVLALGIGAGTAIFSVVDAVVLRGLPFDQYDRIVAVLEYDPTGKTTFGSGSTTTQTFLDWRAQQQSFEALAAVGGTTMRTRTEGGEPGDARGQRVTSEFFNVLRVFPAMGRAFTANDERFGQHKVVILSDGFWRRRFGASPDVIGKTLELNEESWRSSASCRVDSRTRSRARSRARSTCRSRSATKNACAGTAATTASLRSGG